MKVLVLLQLYSTYDADLLKIRAENATFNGILIGSVVMTEILVWAFDAVPGPGTCRTILNGNAMTSDVGHTVRSNGFGRAI